MAANDDFLARRARRYSRIESFGEPISPPVLSAVALVRDSVSLTMFSDASNEPMVLYFDI